MFSMLLFSDYNQIQKQALGQQSRARTVKTLMAATGRSGHLACVGFEGVGQRRVDHDSRYNRTNKRETCQSGHFRVRVFGDVFAHVPSTLKARCAY